jgi:hypothetical protein
VDVTLAGLQVLVACTAQLLYDRHYLPSVSPLYIWGRLIFCELGSDDDAMCIISIWGCGTGLCGYKIVKELVYRFVGGVGNVRAWLDVLSPVVLIPTEWKITHEIKSYLSRS